MSGKPLMLFATSEELVIDVVQNIASERLNVEFSSSFEDLEKKIKKQDYNIAIISLSLLEDVEKNILKLKQRSPHTKIIAMAEDPSAEEVTKAFRAGALDFLQSPINLEDFSMVIERFFLSNSAQSSEYNLLGAVLEEKRVFVLPTDFSIVNSFLAEFISIIRRFPGLDKKALPTIRLCLYEMIINAIEHGNLEIDYETKKQMLDEFLDYPEFLRDRARKLPYSERKIWVSYHYLRDRIIFNIKDEGNGFDTSKKNQEISNTEALSGRGIFITKINMDSVFYNDKGNCVSLQKKLTPS